MTSQYSVVDVMSMTSQYSVGDVMTIIGIAIVAVSVVVELSTWGRATARYVRFLSTNGITVPRRTRESMKSWRKRVETAHEEYSAASHEFLAAVNRGEGHFEPIKGSERGLRAILPDDHRAAIRYTRLCARLPANHPAAIRYTLAAQRQD